MTYSKIDEVVVENHRLGRNLNHDPESRRYAFKLDKPLTTLVSVEHTIHLPILDQGSLGSCVANTGTEYLAFEKVWNTLNNSVQSSLGEPYAIQLYRDVTRADPYPGEWEPTDTGSDGLSLAKVLKARGLVSGYTHTFDLATALAALQGFPLAIGIQWLTGCDHPDSSGLISYSGTVRGGHELLVVGYDAVKQQVKIRNHWGARWGVDGHCFMTVVDFTRALKNDGDVIVLTPLDQPAPTPTPVVVDEDLNAWYAESKPWIEAPHVWRRATRAAKASKVLADKKGLTT